ncbi:MAG: class I SAM-dependent methyltransferase, partial [Methanobacterium sp.]
QLVKGYGNGIGVDVYPWENVDLLVEDASKLPLDNEAFDTVTVVAALNHIPNREAVLSEINRVMKNDGLLIITMISPFVSRIWHYIRSPWDADQKERGMKNGEVFGFTSDDLRKLLVSANYEVVYEKRFMLCLNRVICAKKRQSLV